MACRINFGKLTAALLCATFGLVACEPVPGGGLNGKTGGGSGAISSSATSSNAAEMKLRKQTAILSNTILEGTSAKASAATYVAFVQSTYSNTFKRHRVIKSDLDDSAAEMQTTIEVMREVLVIQKSELSAVRAMALAGTASSAEIRVKIDAAEANLVEMHRAIDGATGRHDEFGQTRGLVPVSGSGSAIDPDLAALSRQIATMKAIANDLANQI